MTNPQPEKPISDLKQMKKFIADSDGRFRMIKSKTEHGQYEIFKGDMALLIAQFGPQKDLQVVYAGDETRSPVTVRQLIGSITG